MITVSNGTFIQIVLLTLIQLLVILLQFKQQEFEVKLPNESSLIPRKSSSIRQLDSLRIRQLPILEISITLKKCFHSLLDQRLRE